MTIILVINQRTVCTRPVSLANPLFLSSSPPLCISLHFARRPHTTIILGVSRSLHPQCIPRCLSVPTWTNVAARSSGGSRSMGGHFLLEKITSVASHLTWFLLLFSFLPFPLLDAHCRRWSHPTQNEMTVEDKTASKEATSTPVAVQEKKDEPKPSSFVSWTLLLAVGIRYSAPLSKLTIDLPSLEAHRLQAILRFFPRPVRCRPNMARLLPHRLRHHHSRGRWCALPPHGHRLRPTC